MNGRFIRVYSKGKAREILLNVDHIWKMEVEYVVTGQQGIAPGMILPGVDMSRVGMPVSLEEGIKNPNAIRVYHVFFGNDTVTLAPSLNDPVRQVLEDIYKNAIKGGDDKPKDI